MLERVLRRVLTDRKLRPKDRTAIAGHLRALLTLLLNVKRSAKVQKEKQLTDRLNGAWVAFEKDIRTDDARALLDAIRMIRGVADVSSTIITTPSDYMNRMKVREEIREKLLDLYNSLGNP